MVAVVPSRGPAALRNAALPALFFFIAASAFADDAATRSQRAKELMSSGRFEEAIPIYKDLVATIPGNPGLLLNLGMAQHMAGHEKEAVPLLEVVLKQQPRFVPALLSLGAARLALRQPDLAVAPLQKAVAAEPGNKDARGMLADAMTGAGRHDAAAEQYRQLTALAPDDPRAWYGLGMAYQAMAGNAFERLQKIGPKSPFVAALIADTRVQRHQYRSAFYFYSEAVKQLPATHGLHAAVAEIYKKTGHPEWYAAEAAKEQALAPADCAAHPGECQFLAGHDLQAAALPKTGAASPEALYWRAKAANELSLQALFRLGQLPPSIELHQLKAQIARDQGQHLESAKEWQAALDLAPGNTRLLHELAVSYFLAADYKSALTETEKVLKLEPHSAEMNFTAGDSWLRLEEPEKAVPYLRASLAADPKMRAADASLGLSLSRLGKFGEAIAHLERALELDDDGSLHYQLARACQASGNAQKAQAAMAQYQELQKRNQEQKEEAAREAQIVAPN